MTFKTMKISYYIFFGFLLILLLFSITTFVNYRLSQAVIGNTAFFSRSTEVIRNSNRFQRNILIMVNSLHDYLLTGAKSFIESYDEANSDNNGILQTLSQTVDSTGSQKLLLHQIQQLNDRWTDEYTDPLKKAKLMANVSLENLRIYNKIYREKFATGDEKNIQQQLREKFREFSSTEYRLRDIQKEKLTASIDRTRNLSLLLNVVSIVLALLIVWLLIRKISFRINKMTTMANLIAAGNYNAKIEEHEDDELTSLGNSLNHMAAELSKNIDLLQHSNKELDQFAHIVSHDLKSPLRGISNVISWLEEDHLQEMSPKVKEYFGLIKERVMWAENLIQALLMYARTVKEKFVKEQVDVMRLVRTVIDEQPFSPEAKIAISPLPVLYTEKLLLYQVFSNLVTNALKYNDKQIKEIEIYCEDRGNVFEFFVQDNGIGIEETYYTKIFTIFQTLRDMETPESTGVGLAIVKKILDNKQQKISVQSKPGYGSVFSFTWPKN